MFWIPGRAHSASKTRVNALMGAPRNDGPEFFSNGSSGANEHARDRAYGSNPDICRVPRPARRRGFGKVSRLVRIGFIIS